MKATALVALLVLAVPAHVVALDTAAHAAVTPLQKVTEMLEGMLSKAKSAMAEEQVEFSKFSTWCAESNAASEKSIAQSAASIEQLSADIAKATSDAAVLAEEISETEATIDATKAKVAELTAERNKANGIYTATHADFSESIDAITRAIQVLKAKEADIPQKALLQVQSLPRLPVHAKAALASFLALKSSSQEGAPEANAYEFQSTSVVELLEKLKAQFIDQLNALEKEEMSSKANFEMLMQQMTDDIGTDEATAAKKTGEKAGKLEDAAVATGDKGETEKAKAAEETALSDRTADCAATKDEVTDNQKVRADEITALEKAIEILSTDAVKGNAETYLPTLLQVQKKGTVLAHLRSMEAPGSRAQASKQKVAVYLQAAAKKLGSRYLEVAAAHTAADPFGKVKKMIKDLIVRLMEEANEEAEHKGWCDTELTTNEQTRKEKTSQVETLTAEIDELDSSIAQLTEDIAELTKAIAFLDSEMAKATTIRQEEKATNEATIKDAQDAQTAVAQAITILKEFYEKAAEATSFVQQAPAIFDSPYKGLQSENSGVIGMLEVIESDFARLESDTKADEATAQKTYDEFMTESKVDKAAKSTDMEHKTAKKQDQSQALTTKTADREGTQKELDAALAYYDKLKPSCIDAGVSYDDRVSRRKEEIESLQEALRILNGEDLAA
mmetsp:Transcript_110875/g.203140  ORF Transcript_110875/g.203140 Transcript_110875/m.203140 type:complete len:675 (+) Transcript_110875:68-2092(+)